MKEKYSDRPTVYVWMGVCSTHVLHIYDHHNHLHEDDYDDAVGGADLKCIDVFNIKFGFSFFFRFFFLISAYLILLLLLSSFVTFRYCCCLFYLFFFCYKIFVVNQIFIYFYMFFVEIFSLWFVFCFCFFVRKIQ